MVFDEKVLEEEELEDLPEDEVEEAEEKAEDASLSVDRVGITNEINELERLIGQAKVLEKREVESKLTRLHNTLVEQNILKDQKTKLLIFTEHRDTLEYLAGRWEEGRWVMASGKSGGLELPKFTAA